jgi:effector-binding domain-containing protein
MTIARIESVELPPQPVAVVRGQVALADLQEFLGGAFEESLTVLTGQGYAPAGPPFARYRSRGDGFEVEAGFPASGSVSASGRLVGAVLPRGRFAQVLYRGPYDQVSEAYEAGEKWLADHRFTASGLPWESYLDEPDVAEPRTVVSLPYRP